MLTVVNPNIQVYLLDVDGRVAAYIGEPGMVQVERVDLVQVRAFLEGARLPLRGTNPMGGADRIFSAAMFPPSPTDRRPPGYLYIVHVDRRGRAAAAAQGLGRGAGAEQQGAAPIASALRVGDPTIDGSAAGARQVPPGRTRRRHRAEV
ncbi:MAG: hypothetical protein NVSMB18_10680 [Acetobacteraceae bacterium]